MQLPSPGTRGGQSAEKTAENPFAFWSESVRNLMTISPSSADKTSSGRVEPVNPLSGCKA